MFYHYLNVSHNILWSYSLPLSVPSRFSPLSILTQLYVFFSLILKKKRKTKIKTNQNKEYNIYKNKTKQKAWNSFCVGQLLLGHWVCPLEKTDFYLCQQVSGANNFSVAEGDVVPASMSVFHYFCCFFNSCYIVNNL